ncbi:hypothetical protein Fmac_014805 [Flemingia macrophylla]|uniref:Uncharacterized protein n=1 Tax=Flemingia macrophylla TaxID=520843 RepID=A0ABD1MCX0_9FABA
MTVDEMFDPRYHITHFKAYDSFFLPSRFEVCPFLRRKTPPTSISPPPPPPPDLPDGVGSLFSAASIFNKKLQKWRQKQKQKEKDNKQRSELSVEKPIGGQFRDT